MPLPYPELLIPGSPAREADRLGMNAIVLVLNWLLLGQPAVCRPSESQPSPVAAPGTPQAGCAALELSAHSRSE